MTASPSTLLLPGQETPVNAGPFIPGGWTLPVVLASVVVVAMIARAVARRRRRADPRELAFQRLINARGWSRAQVRALRRAAEAMGLASPVGVALSPMLTGRAFEADARAAQAPAGRTHGTRAPTARD